MEPPSSPRTGDFGEWKTPTRQRFKSLVDLGFSQKKAAAKIGVPRTTAIGWLKVVSAHRKRATRTGRPRKVTEADVNNIINRIKGHFNERIRPIKDLTMDEGITSSEWTVQRALKQRGYTKRIAYRSPNIKLHQAAKRLAFCKEYLAKPDDWFEHGIFTDEASFSTLLNRKARVLRTKNERYSADCIQFFY